MKYKDADLILADLIRKAVESEGCRLYELDVEGLKVKVKGPDELIGNCAKAIEELLV